MSLASGQSEFRFIPVLFAVVEIGAGVIVARGAEYGDPPRDQIQIFHDPLLSSSNLVVPASELSRQSWARRHVTPAPPELFRSDQIRLVAGLYITAKAEGDRLTVTFEDDAHSLGLTARVISKLVPAAMERGPEFLLGVLSATVALPTWDEEARRRGLPPGSRVEIMISDEAAAKLSGDVTTVTSPLQRRVVIAGRELAP